MSSAALNWEEEMQAAGWKLQIGWPLVSDNISKADRIAISNFVLTTNKLTNGSKVRRFEGEFSDWLGVKHSLMVNSGASANMLTMAALKEVYGLGEVIVPVITWSSDIASILHAGLKPVFVDVCPNTLGIDWSKVSPNKNTLAVFTTHALGFDAGQMDGVRIIEDCCEAQGATRGKKKLGTFGLASNFSFYYAHHMTTIEGGMICTDDDDFYQVLRMMRSHGMLRESTDEELKKRVEKENPDLHQEFTFQYSGFNARSTEINAVIGSRQLERIDDQNENRTDNLKEFLGALNSVKYRTDYAIEGSCSFALPIVLKNKDASLMKRVISCLYKNGVEYRRGTVGGGNQLRQPYLKRLNLANPLDFPEAEHLHHYGLFIGNFPNLSAGSINSLCRLLNEL